jgi:hypothetical protein
MEARAGGHRDLELGDGYANVGLLEGRATLESFDFDLDHFLLQ